MTLWRLSIASVWVYQGLWHKVIALDGRHREIMKQALGATYGGPVCVALGIFECLLGLAVLLNVRPLPVACIQIALLAGMNGAGLLTAAKDIPDPAAMLTMNFAFAMAIWMQGRISQQQRQRIHG
jgi:uncharacterized membrane protein YphA (DoxX/SURF4 family)